MPGNRADAPAALAAAAEAELDHLFREGSFGGSSRALGVAVSGGGDSVALLVLARRWAAARGLRLAAATVDHGLRPESGAEAEGVAALCRRLGVPHATLRAEGIAAASGNLSAAAREARLALLAAWAGGEGLSAVLLGHTLDDQAETVLMRLARGSGAEGLAGMEPAVRLHGALWLRPLLGQRREALRAFLEAEGIGWVEDPTNEDPSYDRVKARRALAALAPLGIQPEGLARTAARLARQRRVLERAMRDLAALARAPGALGEARLDLAAMAGDEPDTALRLLADTLRRVAGAPYRPRFETLSAAWEALSSGSRRKLTLAGCLVMPAGGGPGQAEAGHPGAVLVCREPAACEGPRPLAPGATLWDRRWQVSAAGDWPAGARLAALGPAGRAALREAAAKGAWGPTDLWAEAPAAAQETTPAVWEEAGAAGAVLLAAPLAGYRDPRLGTAGCAISAHFPGWRELPSPPVAE